MPELNATRLQQLRARLDAREAELGREVRELSAEENEKPSRNPRNQVEDDGERSEQNVRETVRHAERERDVLELREIAAARERLDDGSYGRCIDCGVDIPLARLEAQPWASRCVACQEKHEQRVAPEPLIRRTI
jgi:DnaK suppressor protein